MGLSFTPFFIVGMTTGIVSNAIYIFLGRKLQSIIDEFKSGDLVTWEMGFFIGSLLACVAACAGITVMIHSAILKQQKYEVISL